MDFRRTPGHLTGSVQTRGRQPRARSVNETVNLTFRYSQDDYVRALRAHYRSRLRIRFDILAAVALAVFGAYEWRSLDFHWFGVACVATSALFALILVAAFAVIPPLAFRSQPKFRDEYTLAFSQEGIHFRTAHIDSQLQWSLYSSALIDAHSYVLYYGSRQFTVIPKRVFQGADQQQVLERLVTEHVSKIVRRD